MMIDGQKPGTNHQQRVSATAQLIQSWDPQKMDGWFDNVVYSWYQK